MKSTALEVNLSGTKTDIDVDEKYKLLLDIFDGYVGIISRLEVFLKELSHPYMNWGFIVSEARHFSLNYFYLYRDDERGAQALEILATILQNAFECRAGHTIMKEAADDIMLLFHHIARESGDQLVSFLPIIEKKLAVICRYKYREFHYFMSSYYQLDKFGSLILENLSDKKDYNIFPMLNRILIRFFKASFLYWLEHEDPIEWMRQNIEAWHISYEVDQVLGKISHNRIRFWLTNLNQLCQENDLASPDFALSLLKLPGYREVVKIFQEFPQEILNAYSGKDTYAQHLKLTFLFYTLHVPGLSMIYRDAFLNINRTLSLLIGDKDFRKDMRIVDQTFSLLKKFKKSYPGTVLECIHKIGEAVYKTDEIELINYFIDRTVKHGFQFPMIQGTGEDWQIQANRAHLKNIRIFLNLISQRPNRSKRLLSTLIISLAVGGVLIRDTDLFPRDVTQFLNSNIEPVYNLVKQLARLLPTFFNEIGAEGQLRDISTELDDTCHRQDKLIHFLRKQCHVESSSRIIDFIQQVILFWKTKDKIALRPYLPPSIFRDIPGSGKFVDGPSQILCYLESKGLNIPKDLLTYKKEAIDSLINQVDTASVLDRDRVKQLIEFYRLLNEKYGISNLEMKSYLKSFRSEYLPDLERVTEVLDEKNIEFKIDYILTYMFKLKANILSGKIFDVNEAIYHKRHIAVDIPSMYGSYSEAKFDSLGLTLRLESIVNVLFEDLINSIDLELITKPTFIMIYRVLKLFRKALDLDGIRSNKFDTQMAFLKYSMNVNTCSYTQYLDIFKGFTKAVADVINDHFKNIHSNNLINVTSLIGIDNILPKYLPSDYNKEQEQIKDDYDVKLSRNLEQRIADIFFRDRIAASLGLQQLDVFLNRILHTLFRQSDKLSQNNLNTLLNYNPECVVVRISRKKRIGQNIFLLGNKGLNLIRLKQLEVPVPDGFIITTEVFKCIDIINNYPPVSSNFKMHVKSMISWLEKKTGYIFGDAQNPLLLSVRSGSSISQPGMLDSFLNVGINEKIADGLAKSSGNAWFAWDSYRRFLQQYGMIFGIQRNNFDQIIAKHKAEQGIKFKRHFTGIQMKNVAMAYKRLLINTGIETEEFPMDQLFLTIHKVFESWKSKRARNYRQIIGISDDWGTAVTIQTMIFGNMSRTSGSGVVFTHSPKMPGDAIRLWGDFSISNQGEDVVSGLVTTLPISEIQRKLDSRETKTSLEQAFPKIYIRLQEIIHQLIYKEGWNPQEIEFTFQGPEKKDLYILQTRDLSLSDKNKNQVIEFEWNKGEGSKTYIGHGIGVSGGSMDGRIAFTLAEINMFRLQDPKTNLILIRNDTVPDDILEIDAADGILTARGGLTSHAAVVASNLGKTCVVGCESLICNEEEKFCILNGEKLTSGDYISINGQQGSVFKGKLSINKI